MPTATFLGHSCVMVEDGPHRIIVDPFLSGNDKAAAKASDIQVQYVLITHGHGDHLGDGIQIARKNNATVIANFELASYCGAKGCTTHPMHIGGSHAFDFGRVKLTIAHHGGGAGENAGIYTGPPVGFLIEIGGKTMYHSGDTGLFYDMKLIGDMNRIDLAFLPIGDNFTMGIDDAVKAVEFLRPKKVVPIHYNTFDIIAADPRAFASRIKGSEVAILKPGESTTF
ncbi:MAG: metal-dependent hydrolase [candidate division Zixibacteria bacterium]|nr:metal-dependent hydrolase [candidate division Zixibacteria bacterium]